MSRQGSGPDRGTHGRASDAAYADRDAYQRDSYLEADAYPVDPGYQGYASRRERERPRPADMPPGPRTRPERGMPPQARLPATFRQAGGVRPGIALAASRGLDAGRWPPTAATHQPPPAAGSPWPAASRPAALRATARAAPCWFLRPAASRALRVRARARPGPGRPRRGAAGARVSRGTRVSGAELRRAGPALPRTGTRQAGTARRAGDRVAAESGTRRAASGTPVRAGVGGHRDARSAGRCAARPGPGRCRPVRRGAAVARPARSWLARCRAAAPARAGCPWSGTAVAARPARLRARRAWAGAGRLRAGSVPRRTARTRPVRSGIRARAGRPRPVRSGSVRPGPGAHGRTVRPGPRSDAVCRGPVQQHQPVRRRTAWRHSDARAVRPAPAEHRILAGRGAAAGTWLGS